MELNFRKKSRRNRMKRSKSFETQEALLLSVAESPISDAYFATAKILVSNLIGEEEATNDCVFPSNVTIKRRIQEKHVDISEQVTVEVNDCKFGFAI